VRKNSGRKRGGSKFIIQRFPKAQSATISGKTYIDLSRMVLQFSKMGRKNPDREEDEDDRLFHDVIAYIEVTCWS